MPHGRSVCSLLPNLQSFSEALADLGGTTTGSRRFDGRICLHMVSREKGEILGWWMLYIW